MGLSTCEVHTHLQQGPFIALGTLVALLLFPTYCVVDPGEVGLPCGSRRHLPVLLALLPSVSSCLHDVWEEPPPQAEVMS